MCEEVLGHRLGASQPLNNVHLNINKCLLCGLPVIKAGNYFLNKKTKKIHLHLVARVILNPDYTSSPLDQLKRSDSE